MNIKEKNQRTTIQWKIFFKNRKTKIDWKRKNRKKEKHARNIGIKKNEKEEEKENATHNHAWKEFSVSLEPNSAANRRALM
jgi:hypothetical protein